ncbi:hypothetical protein DFS34DRAFT_621288 [Phlyctochytrium arcticum]|nr:hypothetical protein DFS34DRAFT_621288 [Phlyctochytrium arcticum]
MRTKTEEEKLLPPPNRKRKLDDDELVAQVEKEFGQQFHCDSCAKDISNLVRICCAECPDFDLCVGCFSSGSEPANSTHKCYHAYRVTEMLDYAIFEADWGADEELKLVTAIEQYGLGNWEQIAEQVGSKNRRECASHYDRVYLKSEQFPIPIMDRDFDRSRRLLHTRGPPKKIPKIERPPSSVPGNHDIHGYMPGRREFETECENDAEHMIKDLEFTDADTEEDIALKMAMFSMYNAALNRRAERKKFVFARDLTDFRKIQKIEKQRSKEEKDLYQRMRVFAKMQTKEDFSDLMSGLLVEAKLREEIARLQEFRRMGLTTLRDAEVYERDKRERDLTRTPRVLGRASSLRPEELHSSGSRLFKTPAPPHYATPTLHQSMSLPTTPTTAHASLNHQALHSANTPSAACTQHSTPHAPHTIPSLSSNPFSNNNHQFNAIHHPAASAAAAHNAAAASGARKPAAPLDISATEGVELLTPNEQQLCANLRLFPKSYLIIKETILKEYAKLGSLRRRQCRELIKIDVNKTSRIFDFFVEMGWIRNIRGPGAGGNIGLGLTGAAAGAVAAATGRK